MEHEIPPSQKDRQLPMIINLRGDEDLVDEFNWDADQVMEFLGIKRSRLTQISGKELRVARIRRDRYLRPVYREADVRDYQEWTRATATHQSSSRAIEQAIDSLDDRFSDILVVLQEELLQYEDRSSDLLKSQLHKLDEAGFQRFQDIQDGLETQHGYSERQDRQQLRVLEYLIQQKETLAFSQAELQELRAFLGSFHQDIRALLVAQQSLRRDMDEAQAAFHKALQEQSQGFQEALKGMQDTLALLQSGQQQILRQTEPVEVSAASPLKQMPRRPIPLHARRRTMKKAPAAPHADDELKL